MPKKRPGRLFFELFILLAIAFLPKTTFATEAICESDSDVGSALTYRNIGFLGRGYDLLRSDPRPIGESTVDAAIVSPIFDMTEYKLARKTADLASYVPDAADVVDCAGCMGSFQADAITSIDGYKESVEQQVETTSGWNGLFVNNRCKVTESYQRTLHETTVQKYVDVDVVTSCIVYCASLRRFDGIDSNETQSSLDPAFVEAVRSLPGVRIRETRGSIVVSTYHRFLERFGTHYISAMKAGSLYWMRAKFSRSDYHRLETESQGTVTEAAGSLFKDATTTSNDFETKNYTSVTEIAISKNFYSVGAAPSKTGSVEDWLAKSTERPMPVAVTLSPITDIFNHKAFENDTSMAVKLSNIRQIAETVTYCEYLKEKHPKYRINCHGTEPATEQPFDGVFGGTFYMTDYTKYYENVPNGLTSSWECPKNYTALKSAGRYPDANSQMPGFLYSCLKDSWHFSHMLDPEEAFGGLYSYFSDDDKVDNPVLESGLACPSSAYSSIQVGKFFHSAWEFVYACFQYKAGASLGGFFLKPASTTEFTPENWLNPATGVASCPSGYNAHVLLSSKNPEFSFKSYYCLKK